MGFWDGFGVWDGFGGLVVFKNKSLEKRKGS